MSWDLTIKKNLTENSEKIDKFMERTLRGGKPKILYDAGRHLIEAGGKRLRPYLTVKACEAVGGNQEEAVPFAAALEILHNFTLIHDDVMDNDLLRRGTPTVHTKYGVPMAILAGDMLFAKVFDIMSRNVPLKVGPSKIISVIAKTTKATLNLCEGQALDISYPENLNVSTDDYIYMVGAKTSSLFKACAEIGAIVGGGTDEQINALGRFAWDSGISFQIIDDILGLTAEEDKLGKPVGSDIREGKKTLIIINALENASPQQKKVLVKWLGAEHASAKNIDEVVMTLYDIGSIDFARKVADLYASNALKMLNVISENSAKNDLKAILDYFVNRKY